MVKFSMREFLKPNRNQYLLFADIDLNSIVSIGSPLDVIDRLVDELDTSEIEKTYDFNSTQGNNPIHPKTLIKVALYSIHNCRFSLRKIEHDAIHNLGYRWLTGDKGIDHSTMGKFLSVHKELIVNLFSQIVEIGIENNLIDFDVLAIDTVKIRANASYKQFKSMAGLKEEKKKIKHKIKELLEKMESDSQNEIETLKKRQDKVIAAINVLKERNEKETSDNKSGKAVGSKDERVNVTDLDCMMVQQANRETNPGYCITTSVDDGNDFITNFQVNDINSDAKALVEVIDGSKNQTGSSHKVVVADSGFSSMDNLEKLEEMEQEALIPDKRLEVEKYGNTAKKDFDRSKFKYSEKKDHYTCPCRQVLTKVGTSQQGGRDYDRYMNTRACSQCPSREKCTESRYRVICRDQNEEIKMRMRNELAKEKNIKKYKKRSHAAETPYAQIKHNLKLKIFARRGKEKVEMEISLYFLLHNIMKIGKAQKKAA